MDYLGLWIVLGIVGVIILWAIATFNRMIVLRNRIENSWSQVDVQLRRRYDLIPNLVQTVRVRPALVLTTCRIRRRLRT